MNCSGRIGSPIVAVAAFALFANAAVARGQVACDEGAVCDDDDLCTINDTCQGGECVGEFGCADQPACHDVSCDPSVGSCVLSPHPDGTACDDDNPCTVDDVCETGECNGDFLFRGRQQTDGRRPPGPPPDVFQLLACIVYLLTTR